MNQLHLPLTLNESNGDILDSRGFPVVEGCTDNGQLRQLVDLANASARLTAELDEAESKAWDSLSRYKFQMFGYWSAIWVHLNRISGQSRANPWKSLVHAAKERLSINSPGISDSSNPRDGRPGTKTPTESPGDLAVAVAGQDDARKLCNCAGCGDELEQHDIGGRMHGRPYCDGCLRSEGRPPGLSENLTPRQRAKLTHTGG